MTWDPNEVEFRGELREMRRKQWGALGLSRHLRNTMRRAEVSVDEARNLSDKALLNLRGLGRKGLADLRRALEAKQAPHVD